MCPLISREIDLCKRNKTKNETGSEQGYYILNKEGRIAGEERRRFSQTSLAMSATMAAMFCCSSDETRRRAMVSRAIDRQLAKDKRRLRHTVRVLLLGSGESGKSTFLKQMRIINGRDFLADELKQFKLTIYGNIVMGMKVLIDARDKLGIPWGDGRSTDRARFIFGYDPNIKLEEPVFSQFVPLIIELWKDEGIQTAYNRRREFQLGDSIKYYLDNIERIGQMNYVPTTLDVLHSRKATKGISELDFVIKSVPFVFLDVGGQRSQRQKWYRCFEEVTSILFLVSSSEFDQVLFEDRRTNRLVESCNIFETIVNNKSFAMVSIILFLNKMDLLVQKISSANIQEFFPQFAGDPRSLTDVQQFELGLLDSRRRERSRPLFHHFTTAIDTENIKFVFQCVHDTILHDNLRSLMLQ